MADSLTFTFSLDDKTSGPLKRMTDAMEKLADGERHVSEEASTTHSWLERFAEIEIFKTAIDVVGHVAEKLREVGLEAIHVADFARTAGIALSAMAGSSEKGKELFESAEDFATKFRLPIERVVESFERLTLAGVKAKELPRVLQAASDLSIFSGSGISKMGEFSEILAKIAQRGKVTSRELRALPLQAPILSKHLGIDILDVTRDHAISTKKAMQAIYETIQEVGHGPIGNASLERSTTTWDAAVQGVSTSWDKLLKGFGKTPAFDGLIEAMHKLEASLGPGGELGKKLNTSIDEAGKSFGEWINKPETIREFTDLLSGMSTVLSTIGSVVVVIAKGFNDVGTGIGFAASKAADLYHWTTKHFDEEHKDDRAREYKNIGHSGRDPETGTLNAKLTPEQMYQLGYAIRPPPSQVASESKDAANGGAAGNRVVVHLTNHNYPSPGMDTYDFAQQVSNITTSDMTPYFDGVHLAAGSGNG